jgi:hypothetical protein
LIGGAAPVLAHSGHWTEDVVLPLLLVASLVVAWLLFHRSSAAIGRGEVVPPRVRRRRTVASVLFALLAVVDIFAITGSTLDPRALAVGRSVLFPGVGLLDVSTALGLAFMALAIGALVAWARWGAEWLVLAVWLASLGTTAWLVQPSAAAQAAPAVPIMRSSHEFAAVLLLVAALSRLRSRLSRLPGVRWLRQARAMPPRTGLESMRGLPAGERAQVAGVLAIAAWFSPPLYDGAAVLSAARVDDLRTRARRVALVARLRWRGDVLRRDAAPLRAALQLWGALTPTETQDLRDDALRSWAGVPATEPGWVRLLDGALAAAALAELGETVCVRRWTATWDTLLSLRSGRRPGSLYVPLAVPGSAAPPWEQATASAIGHLLGWCDGADWPALRRVSLGVAARGPAGREDERLIAAARIWATSVGDEQARRILARPTLGRDPMAAALDAVASAVGAASSLDRPALHGHADLPPTG